MSELKPCPFCGEEISFDYEVNNFRCVGCGATAPYSPNGESVNTRPIEDALHADLARRDDLIKRLVEDANRLFVFAQHVPNSGGTCRASIAGSWMCVCGLTHTITLHRALMKEVEG